MPFGPTARDIPAQGKLTRATSEARCCEESVALGKVSGKCGGLKARDIVPPLSRALSPQVPLASFPGRRSSPGNARRALPAVGLPWAGISRAVGPKDQQPCSCAQFALRELYWV